MRGVGLVICAALVLACNDRPLPGDASTTGGEGTASSAAAPTNSTGDASTTTAGDPTGAAATCGCSVEPGENFSCDEDAMLWAFVPECSLPEPCERVTVQCPRPGADLYDCQNELVFAEEALGCVLTAMRDRSPGRFIIEGTVGGNHNYHETYSLHLPGGDTVVIASCTSAIVDGIFAERGTLLMPSFFADCLGLDDPRLRHACLFTGVADRVELPACAGE